MSNFNKDLFKDYMDMLKKWQKAINLVSANTLTHLWERHFEDSLSLYDFVKDKKNIYDIGSGAGFPALVLNIAGIKNITLVEADERKAFFLKEIKKLYNIDANIINDRIENLKIKADCITGRAFSPLDKFLNFCKNIIDKKTEMFLLKGENINKEIADAKNNWNFDYQLYKKQNGFIIKIYNISQKQKY